jgi:proteic killer suppression protein
VRNLAGPEQVSRPSLSGCGNIEIVIRSFSNRLAEDIFDDRRASAARRLPPSLYRVARRKVLYLHDAEGLHDLRVPPGNRLEALKGDRAGWYSIRINDQWRVVFRWEAGQALDVGVVDYH